MIYNFNPLEDCRWAKFLENHPYSSVFHTTSWLTALSQTYGYRPVAFSASRPDSSLTNAIVFCEVESWLTGRRLVSLPFSDHCDPLIEGHENDLEHILDTLSRELSRRNLRYVEIRQGQPAGEQFVPWSTHTYCFHRLDLTPSLDTLLRNLHKDSTRRKISRAEREGLTLQTGTTPALVDAFYRLMVMTRRRHVLPPQPRRWFENLIGSFGAALQIRIAFHCGNPIAAILTLRYKDSLVYKYGCSDARFHNLGGMHLLFWTLIAEAKADGLRTLDLGRSDWEDKGLITFKDRWGARRSELAYVRFGPSIRFPGASGTAGSGWKRRVAKGVLTVLPDSVLRSIGGLLYRHVG